VYIGVEIVEGEGQYVLRKLRVNVGHPILTNGDCGVASGKMRTTDPRTGPADRQ